MPRVRVIVLLALLVVVCQTQCVAACAVAACAPQPVLPPCHHHSGNSSPAPCSHQATASVAIVQAAPHMWVTPAMALSSNVAGHTPISFGATPDAPTAVPRVFNPSSIVLRI